MYQVFPDRFGFSDDGTAQAGIEYHRRLGQTPEMHGGIAEPVKWQPRPGEKDYAPDDFYGGTLKGIAKKLPYLKALGIGTLYLNPIVEARSNHRYDTSNYETVDPILGSVDDYVNLCAEAEKLGIVQPILLEVNVGGEEAKSGFAVSEVRAAAERAKSLSHVVLRGLMTIPPVAESEHGSVPYFEKVHALYVDINASLYDNKLDILSMGMSGDYEDAVRCGATMVRVGTAIFGARHYTL